MFAPVLTGPPGADKTSVLEALSDQLVDDDVRHAVIETEALTSAHPPLEDEQWPEPVRALCARYRRFGYPLLLAAVTVEDDDDMSRFLTAVGADGYAVVRLEAPATAAVHFLADLQAGERGWPTITGLWCLAWMRQSSSAASRPGLPRDVLSIRGNVRASADSFG